MIKAWTNHLMPHLQSQYQEEFEQKSQKIVFFKVTKLSKFQRFFKKVKSEVSSWHRGQFWMIYTRSQTNLDHSNTGLASPHHMTLQTQIFCPCKEIGTSKWHSKWMVHTLIIIIILFILSGFSLEIWICTWKRGHGCHIFVWKKHLGVDIWD